MKKIIYTLPLILLALSLSYIHSGCKSDDVVTPPADENVDKEVISTRNMFELGKLLTNANSFSWVYANNVKPLSCPNYYYDPFYTGVVIDYGSFPGCVGVDDEKRSGRYSLAINSFAASDSFYTEIGFIDYRVYKYTTNTDTNIIKFNGTLKFSTKKISGTTYKFYASGEAGFTNLKGFNKIITVNNLTGTVNYNSLSVTSDDEYSIYGSAQISDNEFGTNYTVDITSANALQIKGNCRYPITGVMSLGSASADFSPNANACDAIVKMTKGSTTKTIDLTNTDF